MLSRSLLNRRIRPGSDQAGHRGFLCILIRFFMIWMRAFGVYACDAAKSLSGVLEDIKVKKLNIPYFTGCKSMKKCIQRNKIPEDKIVYMKIRLFT